ncbi:MAG: hypothetical protein KatS3mg015_2605 [Fimbriimonadales bacterium]|nr:MAG: hypothetical protein KatS3mg015_2605 [Fimbriimonadales bacterium]
MELAHRGTLFLDEIGDLDPAVQAKLLKVLEEKRFRRVGGVVDLQVDIRLISATHRDLRAAVERGAFRVDLYYRIGVVSLELPPLRDRRADIRPLVDRILRQFPPPQGAPLWELSPEATELLLQYDWPGNVRELRNVLERATLLAPGPTITAHDLALAIGPVPFGERRAEGGYEPTLSLAEVEKRHILRVLEAVGSDVAKAAERLGVPRSTLYQRLRRYGVRPKGRHATGG